MDISGRSDIIDKSEQNTMNYDFIIEKRIKYGNYSFINNLGAFMSTCLNAVEIIVVSVIVPIIQKEFKMNETEEVIITYTIFIG